MEGEVIVGFIIIGLLVCVLIAEIRTRKYIQNMYNSLCIVVSLCMSFIDRHRDVLHIIGGEMRYRRQ